MHGTTFAPAVQSKDRSNQITNKENTLFANDTLSYDVFVSDPIPQNVTGLLPNGERHLFSPLSTTLIYGQNDAVLADPPLTTACVIATAVTFVKNPSRAGFKSSEEEE